MACLSLNVNPAPSAGLSVTAFATAILSVAINQPQASLVVTPFVTASLFVSANQPELSVSNIKQATLIVSEVCSVSSGDLTVLAASDGPLRTKNGSYILLDPTTNPPD